MRTLLVLLFLAVASQPAWAQLVAPLTTSDGRIACTQGITGVGHVPHWEAVADPRALGGWALSETGHDETDLHFPLCISEQTVVFDVDATLRFKTVGGTHARAAGLVLRAQSANDYYVVKADALDGSVRFYRMAGGRRAELKGMKTPVVADVQHALRVIAKQDQFEVILDDKSLFKLTDRTLMRPGPVGVWSQADSVTYFRSLVVANVQ
ncbi:MAG TPA: hypothetical protein VMI56_15470 [Reyranella sp.]|nr:hypothetical protein [Reyranella sp.]